MSNFSLSTKNVRFVLIGLIVMVAGYILMAGGGSSNPNVFNPEIFNFRRLVISPLLVILGIVIVILAIMKKPRKDKEDKDGQ
jgi:membrane-bound ClpP family serine protease